MKKRFPLNPSKKLFEHVGLSTAQGGIQQPIAPKGAAWFFFCLTFLFSRKEKKVKKVFPQASVQKLFEHVGLSTAQGGIQQPIAPKGAAWFFFCLTFLFSRKEKKVKKVFPQASVQKLFEHVGLSTAQGGIQQPTAPEGAAWLFFCLTFLFSRKEK